MIPTKKKPKLIARLQLNGLIAQRESLTTQRENRLSFEMAKDQRRIALASKQDSSSMKTISILGIVFLPGTFLAVSAKLIFLHLKKTSLTRSSVNTFNDFLRLLRCTYLGCICVSKILAFLGCRHTNDNDHTGDLVVAGEEAWYVVPQGGGGYW